MAGRRLGVSASEMMTLREQGMSNAEIAKLLNCSVATITKYIGKQPEEMTNANRSKNLTPGRPRERKASVEDMLTLRENGMSNKEIAEALQVSYATVFANIGKQPAEMTKKKRAKKQEKCEEVGQNSLEKCEEKPENSLEKCDEPVEEVKPAKPAQKTYQITNQLFRFAYLPSWYEQCHELKEMAQAEGWRFKDFEFNPENPETPILHSYIQYTYSQLAMQYNNTPPGEDEMFISMKNGVACFNTGLLTPEYKDIYAVFVKNVKPNSMPWSFLKFGTDVSPEIQRIHPLPVPARSARPSLSAFHPEWDIRINIDHILNNTKNRERVPEMIRDAWNLPWLLYAAVEMSKQKAVREPDIAVRGVAVHRTTGATLDTYLLPVWLTDPDKPDLVLALKERDGFYGGATCLTPEMAYISARNFGRPQAKWLRDLVEE